VAHDPNPLGLSLGFADGVAMVSLRNRRLSEGLTVRALDLELLDVELPLDVKGGATEFQKKSTRLRNLDLTIDLGWLSERLSALLREKQSPLTWVRLVPDSGGLMLEAELAVDRKRAPLAASLVIGPAEPRSVRMFVVEAFTFDWIPYPTVMLPDLIESALRELLSNLGDRAGHSVQRAGRTSIQFDPVDILLWSVLPPHGWKLPAHDHAAVRTIEAKSDGQLVFAAGEPVSQVPSKGPESLDDAALFAMAREEAGRIAPDVSAQLAEGDYPRAFRELKSSLDASGGPDVVLERVLSIGVADPDLALESSDLADDELARDPDSVAALLAKGALSSREGFSEQAAIFYEQAARSLRKRGRKRLAGMAFMAASRHRGDYPQERVRLLEEAIALRTDDPDLLEGLMEELPRVNRASAAVRAARRLANVGRDARRRALGHVVAGELLRDAMQDPAQAKREFERALRLLPDDARALEGLARSVMDQGDARRAAFILEALIDKSERAGDRTRASHLCTVLGRFWIDKDREAAMTRFKKAHELDPEAIGPLCDLVQTAVDAGRIEAATEAMERGIALLDRKPLAPPKEAFALRRLAAKLYETRGAREDAIAQYEAAKAIDPSAQDVLASLAALYEAFGHDDRRAEVLLQRGQLSVDTGDLDEAAELWAQRALLSKDDRKSLEELAEAVQSALEKDRSHRRLLDLRVNVMELIGAPKPIVDAIDRRLLLEDSPVERAGLLARLGDALERSGRVLEATRAYEETVALDPRNARAINALTKIYRSREDRTRLAETLGRAAGLTADEKQRGEIFLERAKLLRELGRRADAHAAAVSALDAAPDDLNRLALTTSLAIELGHWEHALELAHRRLALVHSAPDPAKLELYVDLAKIAEALKDNDELASALELAHDLATPDSELGRQLAARLAKALQATGRFEDLASLMRRRAKIATSPASERAERFIEAARLSSKIDRDDQAKQDIGEAIKVLTFEGGDPALMEASFDVLESIAKKHSDSVALSDVVGRRASASADPRVRERLRMEQALILEDAEHFAEAVECLEEAADEFPTSFAIAVRLGEVAERGEEGPVAAYAFGRAARLSADSGDRKEAVDLHVRAAKIYARIGDLHHAVSHDRALLALVAPGEHTDWMEASIDRLEQHARNEKDHLLLVEVLGRKAAVSQPATSAKLLLEKATIEATALGDDRAALDSLRRGRALAPEGSEIADQLDEELIGRLELFGQHAELASVLVESAERSTEPARQSAYYLRAARIYDEKLDERQTALARVQAAVRADHTNEAARQLRIALLRDIGRPQALVDALAEEAALAPSAGEAASLWSEAAELLAPKGAIETGDSISKTDVERALQFVRRAATAAPRSAGPLFAAAAYTRALGRPDEEFVALGQMVEREISQAERAAAHLRRVELMSTDLDDPMAAQAELSSAIEILDRLHPGAPLLEYLPASMRKRLTTHATPLISSLNWGLELTDKNADWTTQVRILMKLVDLHEQPEMRANLRTHAGEVLEWRIGDGAAAEREYLAALAILPEYKPAKKALRSFYVAVDRFGDLAENLGIDELREVWAEVRETGPAKRMVEAAEALWPRLEAGSAERAEVQLVLADLYTDVEGRQPDVVHVLEQVVKTAPKNHQNAALERLRVLFLEGARWDLYCDVLRRQAERVSDDKKRALAIVELADALEWKLGDGHAAEQEYIAAIAVDPSCETARAKFSELLSSQNRFADIGENLGGEMLGNVLDKMLELGERDRERALMAADALEAMLPSDQRAVMWLEVARRFSESGGEDRPRLETQRAALLRGVAVAGPELIQALDTLRPVLVELQDLDRLAEVLERRTELTEEPREKIDLGLERARVLSELGSFDIAERALLEVLELAPEHQEARTLLRTLYLSQRRLGDIGRTLGVAALREIRHQADAAKDRVLLRDALSALAELAEGRERAKLLVELVGFDEARAELLYRDALFSDPDHAEAVEGLRALLERQGRYREIAEQLSPEALRRTVDELRNLDERTGLLPAALALSQVLAGDPSRTDERAALLVEVATLQQLEEDLEAAETSLRGALGAMPDHPAAREELRALLVAQRRLNDLADVDEALVAITAQRAADANDLALQIAALSVLASRREAEARADTLVLVASLERQRGDHQAAEAALHWALDSAPDHALARSDLEAALWGHGRFGEMLAALGPRALVQRASNELERDPERVYRALDSVRARLPEELIAEAFEMTAMIKRDGVDPELEWSRRMDHLMSARTQWDTLGRADGQERVRIAIAHLWREKGNVLEELLTALRDAFEHARTPETKGEIAVEIATLLKTSDRQDEALAMVEPLIDDRAATIEHRARSARMLVELLLAHGFDGLDLAQVELAARALALLAEGEAKDVYPKLRRDWLLDLADARELMGEHGEEVARPLEEALPLAVNEEEALALRRRLRMIYEELGDWSLAERHASLLAESDDDPKMWVGLSELRVWLDDREGAERALESALVKNQSWTEAHEALLRLAEQAGETGKVVERLAAWAESDVTGDRRSRAEKLLRASWLAMNSDPERAAALAENAVDLIPVRHPGLAAISGEALEILGSIEHRAGMVAVLTRMVSELQAGRKASQLRLRLADLLVELGREDEARTVIEQGIHRDTPGDDLLVERSVADAKRDGTDRAARRLLALADRLGSGPASRRLRLVGGEIAEQAGDDQAAREAWSTLVTEVGVTGEESRVARASLVRMNRRNKDWHGLLASLIEAAEDAESGQDRAKLLVEAAEIAREQLGDGAAAEALLKRAMNETPQDRHTSDLLLNVLETHGRWMELDAALAERAKTLTHVALADVLEQRAEIARSEVRDDNRAAELLCEAFDAAPTHVRAGKAAEALLRAGGFAEAIKLIERSFELVGREGDRRVVLQLELLRATAHDNAGQVDEAVRVLASLAERAPTSALVRARRVELLSRYGRWAELARALEASAGTVELGIGLRYRLAAARLYLERVGDRADAERALTDAVRMVEGWLGDSEVVVPEQLGWGPEDLEHLLPTHGSPLRHLAAMALELGNHQLRVDAYRLYAQSLPSGPAQWRALLTLASGEREAGDLDAAEFTLRGVVDAVRTSKEVSPRDRVEAERSLGLLLLDRDNPKDAAEALRRAVALLDESVEGEQAVRAQVLVELASAYRAMGDPKRALDALTEARTLSNDVISTSEYEQAIEAAGPSEALALLLERRAAGVPSLGDRAAALREAARMWEAIGHRTRAFTPLLSAYADDPANVEEATRLQELLYRAERWSDLEGLLARRVEVEDLRTPERVRLIIERARVLATQLGRTKDALRLLEHARTLQPTSVQLLEDIAERAHSVKDDALEQEALARLASLVTSSSVKRRALTESALILERRSDLSGSAQCLEQVLPLVEPERMRAVADRLARLQISRGQPEAAVRVWISCSQRATGEEKAACLARAAQIRLDRLGDTRGAMAAYEAAVRAAPGDLGLRRAVIELGKSIGDPKKGREHARAAVRIAEDLGEREAKVLYLLEEARASGSLGDVEAELEAYSRAFMARPGTQALLDELVARARASLPAERIVAMLEKRIEGMDPGLLRGRHRLALARILAEPLGRHWEAQGQRDEAERVDFAGVRDAPALDPDQNQDEPPMDENYRALRAMLDRSGRWTELAELEERRARRLRDPVAQAASLVQVGKLFTEHLPDDWIARREDPVVQASLRRIREIYTSALDSNPEDLEALSRLARVEYLSRAWDRAAPVFRRMERLGGPSWSPPDFEVAAARVALANDDIHLAVARALRARLRDPGSLDALRVLAALCDRVDNAEGREIWIDELLERLDPVLDASEKATLLVRRAEIAKLRGHSDRARASVERALQLMPDEPRARRLHQELMQAAGASRALVDFLEREASRTDVEDPRGSLLAALEVARASKEQRRSLRIARRLERFTSDETVLRRLIAFYSEAGDGAALLRIAESIGSIEALGALSDRATVRLAAACFATKRNEDAFDLLGSFLPEGDLEAIEQADLSPFDRATTEAVLRSGEQWDRDHADPRTVRSPRIVYRLRSIVEALGDPRALSSAALRWLEGLYVASGGHQLFARRLADAYRVKRTGTEAAATIYRRLLAQDPTNLDLVNALFDVLGANGKAVGAKSVLALLREGDEAASFTPLTHRPAEKTVRERLLQEVTSTWLGRLLRTTALSMSARLPGAKVHPAGWLRAKDDERLADLMPLIREVSGIPFEVWLDLDGGERVTIAPGSPPRIVIGEALADDATPAELRYHVARAAMLLELGYLIADRAGGPERQRWLDLLVRVASPDSRVTVPPELADQVELIRKEIAPEEKAMLAAMEIPVQRTTAEIDLEPWMKSALSAADRFGLLVSGELAAALRGLRRTEPRTLGEPFATSQDRIASVKRWRAASDLIAFVLSEDFSEVARDEGPRTDDLRF
jgi:tetratricopeptide (TPR) repeat protein